MALGRKKVQVVLARSHNRAISRLHVFVRPGKKSEKNFFARFFCRHGTPYTFAFLISMLLLNKKICICDVHLKNDELLENEVV
jgi:hypothetical protein